MSMENQYAVLMLRNGFNVKEKIVPFLDLIKWINMEKRYFAKYIEDYKEIYEADLTKIPALNSFYENSRYRKQNL